MVFVMYGVVMAASFIAVIVAAIKDIRVANSARNNRGKQGLTDAMGH